jgi:hypothetical protein
MSRHDQYSILVVGSLTGQRRVGRLLQKRGIGLIPQNCVSTRYER